MKKDLLIGYQALIRDYKLKVIPHWHHARLGERHKKFSRGGCVYEIFTRPDSPDNTLWGQLVFALTRQGVSLEILAALFSHVGSSEILECVRGREEDPVARQLWYLYEFLTGSRLELQDLPAGEYVDILDQRLYYTASPRRVARQRVNDNLLGGADFCPLVRRTEELRRLEKEIQPFGESTLLEYPRGIHRKAAAYIGHEIPDTAKSRFPGKPDFFSKEGLLFLRGKIIRNAPQDGYRKKQAYVALLLGRTGRKVKLICPKPDDLDSLMEGLFASYRRQREMHPVIQAATISFGFVHIHPFGDGNGRLHKFLAQEILSRRGFMPPGLLFPMSAVIADDYELYARAYRDWEKELLKVVRYTLDPIGRMKVHGETALHYRYIDMTEQSTVLFSLIGRTKTGIGRTLNHMRGGKIIRETLRVVSGIPNELIRKAVRLSTMGNSSLEERAGILAGELRSYLRKALPARKRRALLRAESLSAENEKDAYEVARRLFGLMAPIEGGGKPLYLPPPRPNAADAFVERQLRQMTSQKAAFSLIELLVALSILAVVAAIIVPNFIGINNQADDTVAKNNIQTLSSVYASWTDMGGNAGSANTCGGPITILEFLTTVSNGTPDRGFADKGIDIDPATHTYNGPLDTSSTCSSSVFSISNAGVMPIGDNGFTVTTATADGFHANAGGQVGPAIYYKIGKWLYVIEYHTAEGSYFQLADPSTSTAWPQDIDSADNGNLTKNPVDLSTLPNGFTIPGGTAEISILL
jgi:prepilin-type N-terminal cleavage/methylation domain-containing protein